MGGKRHGVEPGTASVGLVECLAEMAEGVVADFKGDLGDVESAGAKE